MIEKILKYKMTWAKALSVIVLISFSLIPLLLLSVSGAFFNLRELLERIRPIVETLAPAFAIGGVVIAIGFYLVRFLTDITTEARDYARKMGSGSQQAPDLSGTEIDEEKSKQVREIASAVLIDVEKLACPNRVVRLVC